MSATVSAAPFLVQTRCAICDTLDAADEIYPANFDVDVFNPAVFSARRLPDRIHYRLVKCKRCGLVRSDPVADDSVLAELYAKSAFTYDDEVSYLQRTYGRYLRKARSLLRGSSSRLLEIGCGNGFLLEQALVQGFDEVSGVEPSSEAISKAADTVRDRIVPDVMHAGLFEAGSFDIVCLFQVFDHISDPGSLLEECRRVVRPGGVVMCYNHNVTAFSARLLGERSPIVDVEHTYLYSPKTIAALLLKHGFEDVRVWRAWNYYPLQYLARLLPLPAPMKEALRSFLSVTRVGKVPLWAPLGNLCAVARSPQA